MTDERVRFKPIQHVSKRTKMVEFHVFGERNSGTNFVDALVRRNIPRLAKSPNHKVGKAHLPYGWKHGFPQMISAPPDCLAIGVFRSPESWLQSLFKKPWHVPHRLKRAEFSDFIRLQWSCVVNAPNFGIDREDRRWGSELQWERHPVTGERFENVLQMRNLKNQGFISLTSRFRNAVLVRYEDVAAEPESFIEFLNDNYRVRPTAEFSPIEGRRGKTTKYVPKVYDPITEEDRNFIWEQLDNETEVSLGYGSSG